MQRMCEKCGERLTVRSSRPHGAEPYSTVEYLHCKKCKEQSKKIRHKFGNDRQAMLVVLWCAENKSRIPAEIAQAAEEAVNG